MLKVAGLQAGYGRARVLFDVSLELAEGEVVTLLGRNGMGKTTTVLALMGLIAPSAGTVAFRGRSIVGAAPERIAGLGIGLVPEGRQVFPTLTVRENLVVAAANRLARADPWTLERVFTLFPRLRERQSQRGGTLSGGEQQMLAIGRALTTNPALLILDEATEGLAPIIRREIWACIETLRRQGQSILMIDKTLDVLKRLADRHYIIERGRTVWSGSSAALDAAQDFVRTHIGV